MRRASSTICAAALVSVFGIVVFGVAVRADTVFQKGITHDNATVDKFDDAKLYFTRNGNQISRDLEKVDKIAVTNEAALNAAEEAFVAGKWDEAVDGYQKAIRASAKPFVKDWAAFRLVAAASKTNRFDAAVVAYIATVGKDAVAAQKNKPALPDSKSTYLDTAVKDLGDALNGAKVTDEQRIALLSFLIDVHTTRKDLKAAEQASEKLDETLAKNPNNPQAGRATARRLVQAAQQALEAKNYAKAISEIESNRAKFTDPAQQADALWYLAEAKLGAAGEGADKPALQDAALAYMRVVAHFKDSPGSPHVAESLMKAALIQERVGDVPAASTMFQQIATQFANDPVAARAKEGVERLKAPATQPAQPLTPG